MPPESNQGRVIAGRYRLVRPLGSGAHGVVDLAADVLHGSRLVAVKRLEGLLGAGDPEPAAERLRWFLHPGWAEVLDEGRLPDHGRFQVTRYVAGRSLDTGSGPASADEVWRLLEDAARVLGALHGIGLIHYDVTPGNWIREERADGSVAFTLTDGGLANVGPVKGIARGTPRFMAPEVTEGKPHDHRADLYSLGLVAYLLATGHDPFEGGAGEVLGRRRREDAPGIRRRREDLPVALESVIAGLLERDPARRPESGAALLRRIAEARGVEIAAVTEDEAVALASGGALVGRAAETARFHRACRGIAEATVTGGPAAGTAPGVVEPVLVVHGLPGSGGTRLLREFAAIARTNDVAVLTLSGREGAADRRSPLRRVADALASLSGGSEGWNASMRLEGRSGRDDPAAARGANDSRVIERFVEVCERTAARMPFALLVEDFPDLAPTVQEALRVLARHLLSRSEHPDGRARPRMVLAVDHGAEDPAGFLIPDAVEPRRPCLPLAPLDADAVRTLLSSRLPGYEPPEADLAALLAACEGLPRLLVGLVAEGLRRGDARREDTGWIWVADRVASYRLDRALPPQASRALEALPAAARRLLTQLVLLDGPASERLLGALAEPASIAALVATPLVSVSREAEHVRYAPASQAIKDALRSTDDDPAAQTAARDALLVALEAHPAPELAPEHGRLLLDAGDPVGALHVIGAAGDALASPARARAQAVLLRAFQASPHLLDDAAARSLGTHFLLSASPNPTYVDVLCKALEGRTDPADLEAAHRLAEHLLAVRAYPRCVALAAAVRHATVPPTVHRVALLLAGCRALLAQGRVADARDLLTEAFRECRRLGRSVRRASVITRVLLGSALARFRFTRGEYARAAAAASRARRLARQARSPHLASQAYTTLAVALQQLGRSAEAERATERVIRLKLALGDVRGAAGNLHNLARMKQQRGAVHDGARSLIRVVGMGTRYADTELASLALLSLGDLYDQQSNVGLALDAVRRARGFSIAGALASRASLCARSLALLSVAAGDATAARSWLLASARDVRLLRSPENRAQHFAASALVACHQGTSRKALFLAGFIPASARLTAVADCLAGLHALARVEHGKCSGLRRLPRSPRVSETKDFRLLLARMLNSLRRVGGPLPSPLGESQTGLVAAVRGVSGPQFRLSLDVLLAGVRGDPGALPRAIPALQTISKYGERNSLSLLRSRAMALRHVAELQLGDLPAAARSLSAALTGYPSDAGGVHSGRRVAPLSEEHALVLRHLSAKFGPAVADTRAAAVTQLHAYAHRLSISLGPTHQPDTRLQTALRTILNVAARLQTGGGLEALLESLNAYAREITSAERTCVVLLGPGAERTVQITSTPPSGDTTARLAPVSHTIIQRVIATRTPLLLHDVFGDTELMERPSITSMSLRSVLCVPMLRGKTLFGVMYADSSIGAGSFDKVDLEILSLFAEQAAAAIETSRLLADVQRSYSELKATQERLIRGERLRVMGEMTSGVAHDFNNLLTAILARIQLLNLGYLPPDVRENLVLIEKAALDAAEVVRRLQGFARARREAGFTRLDMADLCADVVELLRPLWSARRRHGRTPITVRLRASKGLWVNGDPTELREILTNLLKNSLDALEQGGTILISAEVREGRVRVDVTDDGPGIPKDLQAKIFQPFFTTKGERGTGLGLCLSLQIAERHGGDLRLRSADGGGTTATVDLPQAAPDAEATGPREARSSPSAGELGMSVLVVDDDPDVRTPLCAYLERSGFRVASAGSAADGLAQVREHAPDLIISDIVMPGIDGIELCRRVKVTNPRIPVVLMSGQASAIDPTLVKDAGATALLAKPFTMRQVLDLAANLRKEGI